MTEQRWYVVAKDGAFKAPEEHVWTVSRSPDKLGWQTDGMPGCGLTRDEADELANAANLVAAIRLGPPYVARIKELLS